MRITSLRFTIIALATASNAAAQDLPLLAPPSSTPSTTASTSPSARRWGPR
jgi:hypothetical protein